MRPLLGLLALLCLPGAGAAVKPFTFAHITDTHMAAEHPERDGALKTALGEINALTPRPDFIIHTGDITDMGRAGDFARYKKNILATPLTVYHSPGNHETRWADQSINRFKAELGSPNISFIHNGVRFIGFNTAIWLAHQGAVSGDTRRWIVSELAKDPKGTPAVLFCHQPPHYPSSVNQTGDTELWQAIEPFNVRLFIAGHVHAMRSYWRSGIFCHTTKAMMNDDGYYSIVEVDNQDIRVYETAMGPEGSRKLVGTVPLHEKPLKIAVTALGADRNDPSRLYFAATPRGADEDIHSLTSVKWLVDEHSKPNSDDWAKLDPTGPGRYAFTVDTTDLAPGRHRLSVRAVDAKDRAWFTTVDLPIIGKSPVARVFDAGTALQAPAVVDADSVYVGGWDGNFHAVDRKTMKPRWTFQTGGAIIGQADTDDAAVYFGSTDESVYALDKKTGRQIWKFQTKGPIQAHARVVNGTVFVGSGDHSLYAIDAKTGARRWARELSMHEQARPAVANGMVYVGAWNKTFYAFDEATGATRWTRETTGPNLMYSPAISSPLAVGDNVVITYPVPKDQPDAPQVLCLDGKTGATLWGYRPPESTSSDASPSSDGKNVYLTTIKGDIYALDLETGKLVWSADLGGALNGGSAIAHAGQVISNTLYGGVESYDAATGKKLWSYKTGEGFQFSWPAVAGDDVYQTSFDGTLTEIKIPG